MTQEEFTKLVESLKAQGMSEEDILGTLLDMFKEGKVEAEDLKKLVGSMGYEVTEEFEKLASGEAEPESEGSEEISEEEVEEAQEIPESREEEPEEESSEESEEEESSEESEEEESEEHVSEEDEKEEARKLYGLGE